MLPIERLLNALSNYRKRGNNKYQAVCPAHTDKSPSLSIANTPDGRVLLHCHGGCSVHDVLSACGLSLSDLYPDTATNYKSLMSFVHKTDDYSDAVVTIANHDIKAGKPLSREDLETYKKALLNGGKNK